ncbi:MAG: carboxypeptidase-like regulatory domain-containing protein [Bryobacteraceae bacterium]
MQVRGGAVVGVLVGAVLLLSATGAFCQGKKGEDANVRSVEGVVENPQGAPVDGAVVQLKNVKTLQVRSFITQKAGAYYFHGLSPDVEYELRAEYKGLSSPVRRLSVFDSRKKAIVNLKLESQQ